MTRIPRVAAVHDLSCFGRCSLTVILPILSCLGLQACPLPTALFSTHLGGFRNVAFRDFTPELTGFARHWTNEGVDFDCIYSGFLASAEQIRVVSDFIDDFSANRPLVLVDPVMGDGGRLYSLYTSAMQERIRQLVHKADVITPNYTEACFLLEESYRESAESLTAIHDWLIRLAALGPNQVVVTGVPLSGGKLANLCYEASTGKISHIVREQIPAHYPGTGDVFASVLLGKLLLGSSLPEAMRAADDFTALAVAQTFASGAPAREGILLEPCLPRLFPTPDNIAKAGGISR